MNLSLAAQIFSLALSEHASCTDVKHSEMLDDEVCLELSLTFGVGEIDGAWADVVITSAHTTDSIDDLLEQDLDALASVQIIWGAHRGCFSVSEFIQTAETEPCLTLGELIKPRDRKELAFDLTLLFDEAMES